VIPNITDEEKRAIESFELRIDDLHVGLELLKYPRNLALFSFVSNGLERLYLRQVQQVPERDRTLQSVLSRSFGVFIRKVANYPSEGHVAIKNLRVDAHLRVAAAQANEYARFWFGATGYFPEWHQGECDAVLTGPNSIRFSRLATKRQRDISAYQKSFRPPAMQVASTSGICAGSGLDRGLIFACTDPWHNQGWAAFVPNQTERLRVLSGLVCPENARSR